MIWVDTGPLVGLFSHRDPHHNRATLETKKLDDESLMTTWPCIVESMYLLGRYSGFQGQSKLWQLLLSGDLQLHTTSESELFRCADLMSKYADLPMDMADATLVAAAEVTGAYRLWTFDQHFRA